MHFFELITQSLLLSLGMLWQVLWSLILGFLLSAIIQTVVSRNKIEQSLGKNNNKTIVLATLFGAVSSSCSYAAASMSKSLFKKGAGLIPSLAFLFASTNLVLELGIILYILMGWQFTFAEWIGGIFLIGIMTVLVRLIYPKTLIEQARNFTPVEQISHHDHSDHHNYITPNSIRHAELDSASRNSPGSQVKSGMKKLFAKRIAIAQTFVMEFSMLRNDLLLGFMLAGLIGVLVPQTFWQMLFSPNSPYFVQTLLALIIGPIIAVVSFVCSIGNVPLAAILWSSGMPFGGVLAFLYADLIVLPLIDVYHKYYGWKMAIYIVVIFFVTMVIAAGVMDVFFTAFKLIPIRPENAVQNLTMFQINYTFWLNCIFGGIATYMFILKNSNK